MPETYECGSCHGTFDKGWSDQEAEAEMAENYPDGLDADDREIICDDCYNQFMKWREAVN